MSLDEKFQNVLLYDILPGRTQALTVNQPHRMRDLFPGMLCLAARPDGKFFDLETIEPKEPEQLIHLPSDSNHIGALGDMPMEQYKQLYKGLRDNCGLTPGDDYMVVSLLPFMDATLCNGTPSEYLVRMDTARLHELTKAMLEKLADPRQALELAHVDDIKAYQSALKDGGSALRKAVSGMIANAALTPEEEKSLLNLAVRKNNFELAIMLRDTMKSTGYVAQLAQDTAPGKGTKNR